MQFGDCKDIETIEENNEKLFGYLFKWSQDKVDFSLSHSIETHNIPVCQVFYPTFCLEAELP